MRPPVLRIARLTLLEAVRRRIATAALLLGAGFLLLFALGIFFIDRDVRTSGAPGSARPFALSFVVAAGLYAGNVLAMTASVLVALDTLAGEIGSGVVETLCTKPISRLTILLGKWLGCAALVLGYVAFIEGGVLLLARLVTGFTPPRVGQGLPLVLLEGLLLMTLSLAAATRLTTLASGMAVFGLYGLAFVGGWIEQIGTATGNAGARQVGIVASLLVPSEALWRRACHLMQPPLVRDVGLSPFSVLSVPSLAMVLWAAAYLAVALAVAGRSFTTRDL